MCKLTEATRQALKKHGFGRTAVSVRGEEISGKEYVSVRIRDLAAPIRRIQMLVDQKIVSVDFDYKVFTEAAKASLEEIENVVMKGEAKTMYEGKSYKIVYNPLIRGMMIQSCKAENMVECYPGANVYEIAEGYLKAKNDLIFHSWQHAERIEQDEKKRLVDLARHLKNELKGMRERVYASIKDIVLLIQCHRTGDFSLVKQSPLYQKHGCEYSKFLEILSEGRY